jgi:hypothetical protein
VLPGLRGREEGRWVGLWLRRVEIPLTAFNPFSQIDAQRRDCGLKRQTRSRVVDVLQQMVSAMVVSSFSS